jgi:23S rRNA (pseudouridine1915-N3)-methyltransferase
MRIRIIWEGKTKDAHLRGLQAEYQKRIRRFGDLVVEEISSGRGGGSQGKRLSTSERQLLEKLGGAKRVVLDERGREWSSAEFAEWLGRQALRGTRELAFLVGGPDGFSAQFRD